jgi:hypothetical protein
MLCVGCSLSLAHVQNQLRQVVTMCNPDDLLGVAVVVAI